MECAEEDFGQLKLLSEPLTGNQVIKYNLDGTRISRSKESYEQKITRSINEFNTKESAEVSPNTVCTGNSEVDINKMIKSAFDEVNALVDILNISKQTNFVNITQNYLAEDTRNKNKDIEQISFVTHKNKCLIKATNIIYDGVKKWNHSIIANIEYHVKSAFEIYLKKIKEFWILKKIGPNIYGDLSYRCSGSTFLRESIFELVLDKENHSIDVKIPSYLESNKAIKLILRKGSRIISSTNFNKTETGSTKIDIRSNNIDFNIKLINNALLQAQHNFLCIEIYEMLVRELNLNNFRTKYRTGENLITLFLHDDYELLIKLADSNQVSPTIEINMELSEMDAQLDENIDEYDVYLENIFQLYLTKWIQQLHQVKFIIKPIANSLLNFESAYKFDESNKTLLARLINFMENYTCIKSFNNKSNAALEKIYTRNLKRLVIYDMTPIEMHSEDHFSFTIKVLTHAPKTISSLMLVNCRNLRINLTLSSSETIYNIQFEHIDHYIQNIFNDCLTKFIGSVMGQYSHIMTMINSQNYSFTHPVVPQQILLYMDYSVIPNDESKTQNLNVKIYALKDYDIVLKIYQDGKTCEIESNDQIQVSNKDIEGNFGKKNDSIASVKYSETKNLNLVEFLNFYLLAYI